MYSLFEEQIEAESENIDNALEYGTNSYAESTSYLPDMRELSCRPGPLSGAAAQGQGRGQHSRSSPA